MNKRLTLSKGEMEIARLVWESGPCTVRQIHELVCEYREADFATIQTFLRRIEGKGYASSHLEGHTRIYTATARPKAVIREAVEDFVGRLFGGDSMPLVRHLIQERSVDASDISELRALVAKLEQQTMSNRESE